MRLFAEHWFQAVIGDNSAGLAQSQEFLNQLFLEANKPIRDLAITPILLSLTCAVFHQTGKFYSKRSQLYEEGLELLLEQWDKSREIERDEIYRDLSPERKLELLSYLAVKKFEQAQYVLFEQSEIEGYIAEFLGIDLRDSRAVLKAIASQHGLLIERSQKIWSFSHLTFQEYFVAQNISKLRNWHNLANNIIERRWYDVFLLIAEFSQQSSELIQFMKDWIDKMLDKKITIQQFLTWVQQEVNNIKTTYKTVAIRAFYIGHDREFSDSLALKLDRNLTSDCYYALELCDDIESDMGHNLDEYVTLKDTLIAEDIRRSVKFSIARSIIFNKKIRQTLQELRDKSSFHINQSDDEVYGQDWDESLQAWREDVCDVINEYRSWIHDWEFDEKQEECLQDYYYANKLLIDCLNKSFSITLEVQQKIEETLLLPIAEIEKRNRETTE